MLIFAIDDEENVLMNMKKVILEAVNNGAEVLTFTRCEDALSAIDKGEKPNVVFVDVVMPGLSGLEFAVRLKDPKAE